MKEDRKNKTTLTATYEYDTDRFRRYQIDGGQFATGRIYVNKDMDDLKQVTIELRAKEKKPADEGTAKEEWRERRRKKKM